MKLIYSAILLAIFGVGTVAAQIPDNSVSEDWTAVDINGNSYNLYSMLDSGYAVMIDLSAAWCGPCWTIHESGLFQDMHDMYGPEGTNEMRVFYIESEPSNTIDQLNGIGTSGGGGNRATDTQGDWVGDHTFPFIDDASIAGLYGLTAYPTSTFIGADRLTHSFVGSPGPSLETVQGLMENDGGPAIAGTDPRVIGYNGQSLSLCGMFTPSVIIQNHGTDTLTSLDFAVYGDGTELTTTTWTGNLLPYTTTTITFDDVDGAGFTEVTVEYVGTDDNADNNAVAIEGLTVLGPNTSGNVWDVENATPGDLSLPEGLASDPSADFEALALSGDAFTNPPADPVGGFGLSDFSVFFDFYNQQTGSAILYLDKIDMTAVGDNPLLKFSHAYRQYQSENDRLIVMASDDCGSSWNTIFDKQGAGLMTVGPSTTFFVPSPSQWAANEIDLSDYQDASELIIRFVGVTAYGNSLYIDDMKIEAVSGVAQIPTIESTVMYPNPATDVSTLEINLTQGEDVNIFVVDQLGRLVQNVYTGALAQGKNALDISVSTLSSGLYNVVIQDMTNSNVNSLSLQVR
jgi:hypothetical protein